jgi:two-component system response regulator DesR
VNVACRVFIADDNDALRLLWASLLNEDDDIEVVGQAADGLAAVAGVLEVRPDVLVLDLAMPGLDGLQVLRRVASDLPRTRVVVASGFSGARLRPLALELGAVEYFEKGAPAHELREAVRRAWAPTHRFGDDGRSTDG